jgi:excisionase family DNA binding protein
MSDKLLTLKEAAECLRLTEKQVRKLVSEGKIPAYQIGGMYLRFKEENVFAVRGRYGGGIKADNKKTQPVDKVTRNQVKSGIRDFFYFNDFYILSGALILLLIYIILRSIN